MAAAVAELTQHAVGLTRIASDLRGRLGQAEAHLQGQQASGPAGAGGIGAGGIGACGMGAGGMGQQQPRLMNSNCLLPDDFKDGLGRLAWVDDFLLYFGSVDKHLVTALK